MDALNKIRSLTHDQIDTIALSYGKSGDVKSVQNFVFVTNWWFETLAVCMARKQKSSHIGGMDMLIPDGESLRTLLSLYEEVSAHIDSCINGSLDKRYMIYKALRMIQK